MVVRNAYSGSYDALTSQNLTINGLTSGTSTTNTSICPELSLTFLNSVYDTLVDAGYNDAVKNETEYSITVLGLKFYVVVNTSYYPCVYCTPYGSALYESQAIASKISTTQYDYMYNITVRGDSNFVYITYGSYSNYDKEYGLFVIAKAKNLITEEDAYYFGKALYYSTSGTNVFIINKNHNYKYISSSYTLLCESYSGNAGLNTKTKYVCEPQLAYYGTYLIYSMIRGNNQIFTQGNYYKIGNDIYYCAKSYYENSGYCYLFKVE